MAFFYCVNSVCSALIPLLATLPIIHYTMNKTELHARFDNIYKDLNTEQRQAVDHIEGPVLVVAGPGTGKTQILSARIGKILLETDFLPDNILCLTYTDAGRVAMRKRLQDMIGADAYRVQIHTFHSFCNQVIQENVTLFDKNVLEPVSDLERVAYIREIIDSLPKENPLRRFRGDVYYEIDRLVELFGAMKREGWTRKFVISATESYIQQLPEMEEFQYKRNYKEFKAGDPKQNLIDEVAEKMQLLISAANVFDLYQDIMKKNGRYDFDDMINWVITVFMEHEHILFDYQERFQYILVDEFQDTSGTQNKLVELLCAGVEQPNLFVVGDDDQSIYRFQGANIENIINYKNNYEGQLYHVVLQANYRSTQAILDASQKVIQNNKLRLSGHEPGIVKQLLAAKKERIASPVLPQFQVYETPFQEMVAICEYVYHLIQAGTQPERIAILYKENKWGDELLKFFKAKQIPFYTRKKENLFQIPMVQKMLRIIRYIASELHIPGSGDAMLFEILHFDLFRIPPFELAKASIQYSALPYEQRHSLRVYLQALCKPRNAGLFEDGPAETLQEAMRLLDKWIGDSLNLPVIQLVECILMEAGFLSQAIADTENKLWNLDVLRAFLDFVKGEMHRNPRYTLSALLEVIDLMEEQKITMPLYRAIGNENGVNLLTVHGSKGLEFQHVFLMNTTVSAWEGQSKRNRGYKYPDTLFRSNTFTSEVDSLEESRRLFFVAITRAEEYLYISWAKKDDREKPLEPSRFIAEIREHYDYPVQVMTLENAIMEKYVAIYLERNKRPRIDAGERHLIQPLLDNFVMNATALNNYLNCPLKFYYLNLIRVPGVRNESTEFGSAVHFALEALFKKMKDNQDVFPGLDVFLQSFEWYMAKHRESFTREGFTRKLEYGHTILSALYENYVNQWHKVVSIEHPVNGVVWDGVPMKGKMDKLEYYAENHHIRIVDYKTGDPAKAKAKLKPVSAKDPLGGDYWRQAVFYTLLLDRKRIAGYEASGTLFHFLEPDGDNKYLTHEITPTIDDMAVVGSQIKNTWDRIQAHDFYTGCGDEKCYWCNFVKKSKQYVELTEISLEDTESED